MISKTLKALALSGFAVLAPMSAWAQQFADPGDELALVVVEQMHVTMMISVIGLVVIILGALVFATLRDKRRKELLVRFAENGQEVPVELLPVPPSRLRELRRATWLGCLGLGLGIALYIATGDWRIAAWCLILLLLSAASFINAALFYGSSASRRTESGS